MKRLYTVKFKMKGRFNNLDLQVVTYKKSSIEAIRYAISGMDGVFYDFKVFCRREEKQQKRHEGQTQKKSDL